MILISLRIDFYFFFLRAVNAGTFFCRFSLFFSQTLLLFWADSGSCRRSHLSHSAVASLKSNLRYSFSLRSSEPSGLKARCLGSEGLYGLGSGRGNISNRICTGLYKLWEALDQWSLFVWITRHKKKRHGAIH